MAFSTTSMEEILRFTRRGLLTLPLFAPSSKTLAAAKTPGYKLSIRVEHLFKGLPLETQMEMVAEARYHGFEFGDWRKADPIAINKLKNRLGLECACIVGNKGVNPPGLTLTNSTHRNAFLTEIKASTEAALRFETKRIVVLTGNELPNVSRAEQHRSIVEGLKAAHEIVAANGITMILEPLNTLVNHQGYYLNHSAEAFEIVREVDSPYLKILFDIYHIQIMEGNLIDTIRKNIAAIGHFHVADVPGPRQPGTGEIDYANVFRAVQQAKYNGFVAMEYDPDIDALQTLRDVKTNLYDRSV